jgi:carbamoyl-phosphate synthase large subunit
MKPLGREENRMQSLHHAGGYDILGWDISPVAFCHYDHNFNSTFVVAR